MNEKHPSNLATDDEIKAAIDGTLRCRQTKGTKTQKTLTSTDCLGRPNAHPIGVTTGLPILLAWCYIFQKNEENPTDEKLTDEEISDWMKEEFPGRRTPDFDRPDSCRKDYNKGKFTKSHSKWIIPKIQSKRSR